MKKTIISLLISLIVWCSLTGCGGKGNIKITSEPSKSNSSATVSSKSEETSSSETETEENKETFEFRDELTVSVINASELPKISDGKVVACYTSADGSGTTSIRYETEADVRENKYPANSVTVFGDRTKYPETYTQRDRDLGQTFRNGKKECKLDAVYLKIGPNGGDESSLGAAVAIQIFEVSGDPKLNDNATPGYAGVFDRVASPELDDYLTGETYKSVAVAKGVLPTEIGPDAILKFDLTSSSEITLLPEKDYAFMVMLIDPKPSQQLSFANNYYGSYTPDGSNKFIGHGIRREGDPKFTSNEERVKQSPVTLGFPDVCTWRDYYFFVTGK